jgi:hypothetical protein
MSVTTMSTLTDSTTGGCPECRWVAFGSSCTSCGLAWEEDSEMESTSLTSPTRGTDYDDGPTFGGRTVLMSSYEDIPGQVETLAQLVLGS